MENKKVLSEKLLNVLNGCMLFNVGKIVFSMLILNMLESLVESVFLVSAGSIYNIFILVIGFFVLTSIIICLYYGFYVMLFRLLHKEYVTLGYLFIGFKRFKILFDVFLRFALIIFAVAVAISCAIIYVPFVKHFVSQIMLKFGLLNAISIFSIFIKVIVGLSLFPFCFVFLFLASNPNNKKYVFRKSVILLRGRKLFFLKMYIAAGGKQLLRAFFIWIFLHILNHIYPSSNSVILTLITSILNFVYIFSLYVAEAKMSLMIPILYTEFLMEDAAAVRDYVNISKAFINSANHGFLLLEDKRNEDEKSDNNIS